jgi:gamma-glutamyl-gamma-aminobutyrate hydrolase PuuD
MSDSGILRIGLSWHGGDADYDAYEQALQRRAEALGIPIAIVWLAGVDRPTRSEMLPELDGICFTGGEDVEPSRYGRADAAALCSTNPERDSVEWSLLEALERKPPPLLAICRGAQLINVFHGGTLIPDLGDLNTAHRAPPEKAHNVHVLQGTMLAAAVGSGRALTNSSHHQAVDVLATDFCVAARAGDGTIEAFERTDGDAPFTLAVQWHPELMPSHLKLSEGPLDAFIQAASGNVPRGTMPPDVRPRR